MTANTNVSELNAFYKVEKFGASYRLIVFLRGLSGGSRGASDVDEPAELSEGEIESRFDSSISRSRCRVRELALCNHWDYFVTMTVAPDKFDRYNLPVIVKRFGEWVGNFNKRYGCKLRYIVIPEQHKNGAWHFHGLFSGVPSSALVTNEHGYMDIPAYRDRFGYISLSPIEDKRRCATYVTKYISKDLARGMASDISYKGCHLFYASRGLQGKEDIVAAFGTVRISEMWQGEYCAIAWADDVESLLKYVE